MNAFQRGLVAYFRDTDGSTVSAHQSADKPKPARWVWDAFDFFGAHANRYELFKFSLIVQNTQCPVLCPSLFAGY
jgi:hypothetical protein